MKNQSKLIGCVGFGGGGGGYQAGNAAGPDAKDGAGGQSYNSVQNQSYSPGVQSGSGRIVITGI
jgi:hypothetical protein